MMKRLLLILLFGSSISALAQTGAVTGYCTSGAQKALVSGLSSTNTLQGIVPSCTVTVYLTGTTTLANPIYSNASGTPLGNPFTAATSGQWLFYASTGVGLDVVLSGGTAPNSYGAPVVLTDISPTLNGVPCLLAGCTFTGPVTDTYGFIGPLTGHASLDLPLAGGTMTGPLIAPNLQPVGPGSYTFYVNAGTVYARNNNTMLIAYSGTDAAVVINQVLNSLATVGGTLYFQKGVYPLASCTLESVAPYNTQPLYYAVGIPSTNAVNYPAFIFIGEAAGIGSQVHPAVQGTVFNVTSAAESCAGSGHLLDAFWMRPNPAIDTEYPPGGALYWNDHVAISNIAVNFPSNTRGYEIGIDLLEASYGDVENVQFGFQTASTALGASNLAGYRSPATPSDGTLVVNTQVDPGYDMGYSINTEHSVLINTEAYRATTCYGYGMNQNRNASPIVHNSIFIHPQSYDCVYALRVGTAITNKAPLDLLNYDLEYITSGPWASVAQISTGATGALQISGFITWDAVITNVGPSGITTPFANDGYSGTWYDVDHDGKFKSNLGISVTGNGSLSVGPDYAASRASEANTSGNMPWYELDGPNGDTAISEFGGATEFWFCPGAGCTTSWVEDLAFGPTGANTIVPWTVGSNGTPLAIEQWVSQTTSLCSAAANNSCVFNVAFPKAFPDTNWHIQCSAENATGAGIIGGGWPITSTTGTILYFKDLSGSSNTLSRATCRGWE